MCMKVDGNQLKESHSVDPLMSSKSDTKNSRFSFAETTLPSENDLESDSTESEDNEWVEASYRTRESAILDLYYTKEPSTKNRIATQRAVHIAKQFHERVLNHVVQRHHEQPQSLPTSYNIGISPPPKPLTSKAKKSQQKREDENELSPKRIRRYNAAAHQRTELERKRHHPAALHQEIFFNEPRQQNDGPFCKCYEDYRETGVIHGFFPNEGLISYCNMFSNNLTHLKHYVVEIRPDFPLHNRQRSAIRFEQQVYDFSGFSLFFHRDVVDNLPRRWLNRMFPEYSVRVVKAEPVEGFCVYELELFYHYVFQHLLELCDINRGSESQPSCPFFHVMPRFVNINENAGGIPIHNLLPMAVVLEHLIANFNGLDSNPKGSVGKARRWLKGQLVSCSTKKPAAIRVDNLIDRGSTGLCIVHLSQRPTSQAAFAKQQYLSAQRRCQALKKRLFAERSASDELTQAIGSAIEDVNKFREEKSKHRERNLEFPMKIFHSTGLYADITQHVLFTLTVCWRVRYHWVLSEFERILNYKFENRLLLELALTHPSNLTNYGTNSDHARNTLRNCGLRDIRNKKKARDTHDCVRRKGVTALMNIMAKFGSEEERHSTLHHNERLEFLGDAIVELLTSHHLFYMMPYAEEGVLASHRSKLVRNINLGQVGRRLEINKFLLHLHGPDLSQHDGMTKAMANAFEALMASIYLDSNIDECDRVLSQAFFGEIPDLLDKWLYLQEHPLKQHSPADRHWIERVKWLQKLQQLENYTGIYFHHIRLLAKAFTRRQVGYNNLTQGHNQRLEFLGDTVLQFFVSDYLYRHFPRHQEGHLSLLRSCLVSNKTQSVICDDLRLTDYLFDMRNGNSVIELTLKDKADLVEAYLGAIFVDRGFDFAETFCRVCFFPRLDTFIRSSRWNDPKSQLQQCCLTLRRSNTVAPDIPEYRTVGIKGPTNTREFRVIVFFRNRRLASGIGHTIHAAELKAAENALIRNAHLFGSFNLESTYLGERIKEYNEWADEQCADSAVKTDSKFVDTGREEGELVDDDDDQPMKKQKRLTKELEPVKISSDEESDISTD